ncbi:hypothetical protein GRZ55_11305 [Chelativorans sp. ZYF759]|uniref:hypothetical protein n=1 Tax=Chelativorans sp. ZYF759 TaxID=2692213 RepID=UPI00145CC327|nr:hypothetical protein [Chelativorans sp. ZYF759]NMG39831.1 hypothetical protein [Chelativorans sp. ZYF759]
MGELTIITTRPERALVTLFGRPQPPEGVSVVTTSQAIGNIPNGSRCFAIWFEPRKYRSSVEWAWIMRRERGGVVGLELEDLHAFGLFAHHARGVPQPAPRSTSMGHLPAVTSVRAAGGEVSA